MFWQLSISDNDDSIYCDNCNLWVHINCNNLNFIDYLNGNDDPWFCLQCDSEFYPIGTLNNKTFNQYIKSTNLQNKDNNEDNSSNLFLKPPSNLNFLFNQFNNSSQFHDFKNPENVVKCKYCNLEEIHTMKIPNKKSDLSLFHISTSSFSQNCKDLEYLLKTTNTNFPIIAISETRILKNTNIVKILMSQIFCTSLLQQNQQLEELYYTFQTIQHIKKEINRILI